MRNRRGFRVFSKLLLEADGDIPKIFRTGLLRKDTFDSFSQLMSEIEDLERLQEMDESDPRRQALKQKLSKENDKLQKLIDKIVEEDNDEDDLRELEELANGKISDAEGGNTSIDSMMEDTPSNYDTANQRIQADAVKSQARRNIKTQQRVPEDDEDEDSQLGTRRLKKRRRIRRKKKPVEDEGVDIRDLMLHQAYGGLNPAQVKEIQKEKRVKDKLGLATQMRTTFSNQFSRPPVQRVGSNARMATVHSQRRPAGRASRKDSNKNQSMMVEDFKSDLGGGVESVRDGAPGNAGGLPSNQSMMLPQRARQRGASQARKGNSSTRAAAAQAILSNTGFNHRA